MSSSSAATKCTSDEGKNEGKGQTSGSSGPMESEGQGDMKIEEEEGGGDDNSGVGVLGGIVSDVAVGSGGMTLEFGRDVVVENYIQGQINLVEGAIIKVEHQIEGVEKELETATGDDRAYFREKEKQLREKEKQLREEKKQLREERAREQGGGSGAAAAALQPSETDIFGKLASASGFIPQTVPSTFRWVSRPQLEDKLVQVIMNNIAMQFEIKSGLRAFDFRWFNHVRLMGASGTGKTRLGFESSSLVLSRYREVLENQGVGVAYSLVNAVYFPESANAFESPSCLLGSALAASYFGKTDDWRGFVLALGLRTADLPFDLVSRAIQAHMREHSKCQTVVLILHIDEFQARPHLINDLIRVVRDTISAAHRQDAVLIPVLSGTVDSTLATELVQATGYTGPKLNVGMWEDYLDASDIVLTHLGLDGTVLSRVPLLEQLIGDAGHNFRFLEMLVQAVLSEAGLIQKLVAGGDEVVGQMLSRVSNRMLVSCGGRYSAESWARVFSSEVAVARVCLAAINGEPVGLDWKINGITLGEARESGAVMLVGPDAQNKYIVHLPLLLLRVFNDQLLHACTNDLLDPFNPYDDSSFERFVSGSMLLRSQLLYQAGGREVVPLGELRPGVATGATKDIQVCLRLKEVFVLEAATPLVRDSDLRAVSVQGTTTCVYPKIDALAGDFDLVNFPKSPAADGFSAYPGRVGIQSILELRQFKAVGFSPRGGATDRRARFVNEPLILQERDKALDNLPASARGFRPIFLFVTNKMFEEAASQTFPPADVVVIHRGNWTAAFGQPFAHRGLLRGDW